MSRASRIIWWWVPVVVWLGVIALASGELGAHAHSDVWLWRALHQWFPQMFGMDPSSSPPTFLPWWARKLAHVGEYAVLGALVARALQLSSVGADVFSLAARRPAGLLGLPAGVALVGLPFCVIVAILDEVHQSTLASRTGSPRDVLIDVVGAGLGLALGWRVWRGLERSVDLPAGGYAARPPRGG